jgi:hypothetical protein
MISSSRPLPNLYPGVSKPLAGAKLRAVSNGLGVQSLAMLYLAADGLIGPEPDVAITGDTDDERTSALENLRMLQGNAPPGNIRIIVRKDASIRDDLADVLARRKKRFSNPPFFIKNADGSRGILTRGCTRDYKIVPVRRELRKLLGKASRGPVSKTPIVELWIGITTDEVDRMEPSRMPWIYNRYPLIEIDWSRQDCERFLNRRFS